MEANIQQLIEREKEAEEKIKMAMISKEEARRRAEKDAELALGILQSEQDKKIKKIENKSKIKIRELNSELEEEYQRNMAFLASKDIVPIVEVIAKIICGESGNFDI